MRKLDDRVMKSVQTTHVLYVEIRSIPVVRIHAYLRTFSTRHPRWWALSLPDLSKADTSASGIRPDSGHVPVRGGRRSRSGRQGEP